MPKVKNFDDAFKARVVERVNAGDNPKIIAKDMGISLGSVRNWTNMANGAPKKTTQRAPKAARVSAKGNGNGSLVEMAKKELQTLERKTRSLNRFIEEQTTA